MVVEKKTSLWRLEVTMSTRYGKEGMDKQKNNLIRSLSIVIVIVWLFIVIINATLSFTEGVAFIDHCLVWSTLSLAFSLFALRVAGKDKEK